MPKAMQTFNSLGMKEKLDKKQKLHHPVNQTHGVYIGEHIDLEMFKTTRPKPITQGCDIWSTKRDGLS